MKLKQFILNKILIPYDKKTRLPIGSYVSIRKSERFPDAQLAKVISHNTPQREYHVTTKVQSKQSSSNPIYLKSNSGYAVLKEEFDHGEFVHYSEAEEIVLEPRKAIDYLTSPVGLLALGVLLFCSGGLVALEFVR